MADDDYSSVPDQHVAAARPDGCRTLTALAVGIAIVTALYFAKMVLLPVTLAVLLSFVLSPLVRLLRRAAFPRGIAVIFSVGLALAITGGLAALIGTEIADAARDLPSYQHTIDQKLTKLRSATIERIFRLSRRLHGTVNQVSDRSRAGSSPANGQNAPSQLQPVPVEVHEPPPGPLEMAQHILLPVLSPLLTLAIIFVVAVFVLMQQNDLRDRIIRLFGARDLHRTTLAMDDAAKGLSRYFLVQIGINAAFGAVITAGLYFIGLPEPLLWGVIAGLLRFVPYVGSYIAAGIPILLAAAVNPGWSNTLWVAALFLVTEPITGQFIEPMAYGRTTGLSPIAVAISAIFWTWLWGPVGLILSTPLTLCVVVLGRHVEQLEFLSVLLGDRPALTSAEHFYQRILADDLEEVEEQAEETLKDLPLTSYYDDIVLKALEMAAHDSARGLLNGQRLAQIKTAILELATDLQEFDQKRFSHVASENGEGKPADHEEPPLSARISSHTVESVCIIAAHTQLDEIAAAILAQLLRKHGLRTEVLAKETVSRAGIAHFDKETAILCICYISDLGRASHLRFLLRRLRQRLPSAHLFAIVWPSDHPVLSDQAMKSSLGADRYLWSLRQAVDCCLEVARKHTAAILLELGQEPAEDPPSH
jgi:predicted PurR-regulated permease PerM